MEKQMSDYQLIQELDKRGYAVLNLWSVQDVQDAIDSYNMENSTEYSMIDEIKRTILSQVFNNNDYFERINNDIQERVSDFLDKQ
jgi:hypothetical protein